MLTPDRKIALCDYITRTAHKIVHSAGWDRAASGGGWSAGKGGDFSINAPSPQVLERNSCLISSDPKGDVLELRFVVGLPAAGRNILGDKAIEILTMKLPDLVAQTVLWKAHDQGKLMEHILCVEDQAFMRGKLREKGLVAFVGNGAVLPRESGVSMSPMKGEDVVPFVSPPTLEVCLEYGLG